MVQDYNWHEKEFNTLNLAKLKNYTHDCKQLIRMSI